MVNQKQCKKCLKIKFLSEFPNRGEVSSGFRNECKLCIRKYNKNYREKNKERLSKQRRNYYLQNRESILLKRKEYIKKHIDWKIKYDKQYYLKNKSRIRKYKKLWAKQWRRKNRDKAREISKISNKKRHSSIKGAIDHRMEVNIRRALKQNKNGRNWEKLVGYTVDDLKNHLENQFIGLMTWDKFLKGEIHIDHRQPKSWFKYNSYYDEEFKKCWALNNLQPKWAKKNISKYNRYAD